MNFRHGLEKGFALDFKGATERVYSYISILGGQIDG
jgi:hypothetical protein